MLGKYSVGKRGGKSYGAVKLIGGIYLCNAHAGTQVYGLYYKRKAYFFGNFGGNCRLIGHILARTEGNAAEHRQPRAFKHLFEHRFIHTHGGGKYIAADIGQT